MSAGPASLPDPYAPPLVEKAFAGAFAPPGSKSLTNRALLLAALAGGASRVRGPLVGADDAERMVVALRRLGARIEVHPDDAGDLAIEGVGGRWRTPKKGILLELNNAGTATRFLTAAALLGAPGTDGITIDGNARMRQRPIGELVDLLRTLGAECRYLLDEGYPPVNVEAVEDLGAVLGEVSVGVTLSSQFVSALLLIAPWLPGGLGVRFEGDVTSASYIEMTLGLLRRVGVETQGVAGVDEVVRVEPAAVPLRDLDIAIEPDASSATYFFAAAALFEGASYACPGVVESLQADARFPGLVAHMGADLAVGGGFVGVRGTGTLRGIEADLRDMPDAAMTLASVAAFAEGPTTMHGLRTLRVKETDRIEAMRNELAKVGVGVEVVERDGDTSVVIAPPEGGVDCGAGAPRVEFETYDDHRMAMSLALIGLRRPNTCVRDPGCVGKTYPGFWTDLQTLTKPA